MRLAVLQIAVVLLLSIVVGLVHLGAKTLVEFDIGLGVRVLILLLISLPLLSRYLD